MRVLKCLQTFEPSDTKQTAALKLPFSLEHVLPGVLSYDAMGRRAMSQEHVFGSRPMASHQNAATAVGQDESAFQTTIDSMILTMKYFKAIAWRT